MYGEYFQKIEECVFKIEEWDLEVLANI